MKTTHGLLLKIGVLLAAISFAARANDGVLDPTCGAGGKVTVDIFGSTSNAANASAVQGNGKIVVAGIVTGATEDFALARYNADGSLDTSFGSGGLVTTDFSGGSDRALALAIQSNGKIVAAGFASTSTRDFALARYNTDGSLDASFGTGGKVTTDFLLKADIANAVLIQADGKILAAGRAFKPGVGHQFALARYNTDGSLDPSFGTGGEVTTTVMGLYDEAFAVAIQPSGKIVAAGYTLIGGVNNDFALARYSGTDGSLDASFGTGGIKITDFAGGDDEITSLKIQTDGRIIAAGLALSSGSAYDFALARYNAGDGSLDSSFGIGGRVTTDFAGGPDQIGALAIQPDGKLVASGGALNSAGDLDFGLARYDSDGSLDSSFGTSGKTLTDFSGSTERATGIAVLGNGQLLAAGLATTVSTTGRDFALARYSSAGILDLTFGTAGKVTTDLIGSTPNEVHALAVQGDGKIVLVGLTTRSSPDFGLARLLANGSLDGSFGAGGLVLTDFFGSNDTPFAALIQPDGKIVAAGFTFDVALSSAAFALSRYNPDGSLDLTFGNGGRVVTAVQGYDDEVLALALQADGKIVAAGTSGNPTGVYSFALARYNTDGSLDATFGSGGTVTTSVLGVYDVGYAVAIQADQRIVVSGVATDSSTYAPKFALARYNTNGALDASFGTAGLVTTSFFGNDDEAFSVAIQADQKIVVSGYAVESAAKFALARYNTDGTLDSGFGTGGLVSTSILGNDDEAFSIAVQRDQKIVATGYAFSSANELAVARFNTDGTLDTSFGTSGTVTTGIAGVNDQAHASAIQADGKILAAGFATGSTTGRDFALARYFVCDFLDVPLSHPFHDFICSIAQAGVTAGVGGGLYGPDGSVTRAQMAVFLLTASKGPGYAPPACTPPGIFGDVPCPSGFAVDWIEELYNENITAGCSVSPLLYCPDPTVSPDHGLVTRAQMAVFLLRAKEGAGYTPPACTPPGVFSDVPCPGSPATFAVDWIEELYRRGIAAGYPDGTYGPNNPVTRGQMAVFLVATFNLQYY